MDTLALDLTLSGIPFLASGAITWRLVWPRWKLLGKTVFFFALIGLCSLVIGHWSVVIAWSHQALGIAIHIWFCRKHGFAWYAVEDPERYRQLSREWVTKHSSRAA